LPGFTGTALVLSAPSTRARLAPAIYAVSVAALFGRSELRVAWRSLASTAIFRVDRVPQAHGAIEEVVVRSPRRATGFAGMTDGSASTRQLPTPCARPGHAARRRARAAQGAAQLS
jgi:hypothetical protein